MLRIVGSSKKCTTFASANEKDCKTVYGGSNPPGTSKTPEYLFEYSGVFFFIKSS